MLCDKRVGKERSQFSQDRAFNTTLEILLLKNGPPGGENATFFPLLLKKLMVNYVFRTFALLVCKKHLLVTARYLRYCIHNFFHRIRPFCYLSLSLRN